MKYVGKRTAAATWSRNILPATVIALAMGVGSSASTLAKTATNPPPEPAPTAQAQRLQSAPKPKPDVEQEVLCKDEPVTGTRLSRHPVCHTRAEWRQMAHDSADYLDHRYLSPR
jgi:hypothetical protein